MQTFLPWEDFTKTAKSLDRARLGKQRLECKQIFNAMYRGGGWQHHPVVRMWRGHGRVLLRYYEYICVEWMRRGYVHTMKLDEDIKARALTEHTPPPWLGATPFHEMHRFVLCRKMPEHYLDAFGMRDQHIPKVIPRYLWPIDKDGRVIEELKVWVRAYPNMLPA
jgi:hypothetical protein